MIELILSMSDQEFGMLFFMLAGMIGAFIIGFWFGVCYCPPVPRPPPVKKLEEKKIDLPGRY